MTDTIRSVRDYQRAIPAGETITIPATGEFVFAKRLPRRVRVWIEGNAVDMESGDVVRPEAPFDSIQVENPHDDPTAADFTIGWGAYDRKIIQGDIGVEPQLRTEDGTLRPDTRQRITATLLPAASLRNQTISFAGFLENKAILSTPNGNSGIGWDGERWAVKSEGTWYEYNERWEFIETRNSPTSNGNDRIFTWANDDKTKILFSGDSSRLFYASRYRDDAVAVDSVLSHLGVQDGIENRNGVVFAFNNSDNTFYRVTIDKLINTAENDTPWEAVVSQATLNNKTTADISSSGANGIEAINDRELLLAFSTDIIRYDLSTETVVAEGEYPGPSDNSGSLNGFSLKDGLFVAHTADGNGDLAVGTGWYEPQQITFTLDGSAVTDACQAPGLINQPRNEKSRAVIRTTRLPTGITVTGELIRLALDWITGDWAAIPDDYLDHVYRFAINGREQVTNQAVGAAQSFAALGIEDRWTATLPVEIELTIDNELTRP